jgi:putative membrane protein
MKKTIMWGALAAAVAAGPAFAQSSATPGQSGTPGSGQSGTSGQSGSGSQADKDKDRSSGQSGTHSGTHSGTQSGAEGTQSATSGSQASLDGKDRKFIEDAARDNMAEIQLAKLAEQKAQSDEVKQFAKKMAEDHQKASEELKTIASQKGVTVPTEVAGDHKSLHQRLDKMSGAEFDKAFMKDMVKQHKKDVEKFEKASDSAKDDDVKQFASKTLPTLKAHHEHAQQLARTIDASGTTAGASTDRDEDKDKDKRPASDNPPPQR